MEHDTPPDSSLPIVGLGGSAGGLRPIQQFLGQMPADSGMAFVVILHLSADYESNAAALLQQHTAMPVMQVVAPVRVLPNHVYVIPPSKHLSMMDGVIELHDPDSAYHRRAPIDLFFRTLAETHGRNAAAIVFSGSGADGAMGIQRIKERGGLAITQDPEEAEFDSMPRSAIATGLVDFILSVATMPATLMTYWRNSAAVQLQASDVAQRGAAADTLREIFVLLRTRTGHDFSQYKRATVLRRIGRRMQVNTVTGLVPYLAVLRSRPEEVQALLHDLLISVTNFFRDAEAWQALAASLALLFRRREASAQVRVWVAGCATGEEAYTVAMLLYEHMATVDQHPSVQVFATDIDEAAISVARQGLYPDTIAADVSTERLARFFTVEQGRYRIKKEIRDIVLFAPHNVLRDPPFSKLDMITCRNLLIYLNREVQEQVLQLFHFSLRHDGLLLLGTSESTDGVPGLFTVLDKAQRLFQRRAVPGNTALGVPVLPLASPPRAQAAASRAGPEGAPHSFNEIDLQLLAQHGPPSLIVSEEYDIVQIARGAGRFLQIADGEVSSNLLKLVHPDLRLDLRTALFSAGQHTMRTETRRLRIDLDGRPRMLSLVVQPIREPDWARSYIQVIFYDMGDPGEGERGAASDSEPLVRQLEDELQRTKEQLRATIEQYETVVEEYKAANEELQAINEELRAASEELETSKEELQSLNEELTTVNQEFKHKIEEVSQSNNDLQNLMASTEIGTIFIDRDLLIKRYTPSAQQIFNLIPADINRPLAHITHTLTYDQFPEDGAHVLAVLGQIEREVASRSGQWYLARLRPYRTEEDRIDGVVLTFIDITARKQAEQALRASEEHLRLLIENVRDYAIFTLDPQGCITSWNPGAERALGYSETEALGQPSAITFTPEDRAAGVAQGEMRQALEEGRAVDERWHIRKDGSRFYASGVMTPVRDGDLRGFVKVMRDLTAQKQVEEELRRAHEDLEQKVIERTSEQQAANASLQIEIAQRRQAESNRQQALRQLVTAQEEERRRIARELHDQLGQQLSALRLGLSALSDPGQPADGDTLARLHQIAAQLDADVDRLALELRPSILDDLGLRVALQQHVEEWAAHHGVAAEFQASGLSQQRLPPEIETALYRVVQEALTNVVKHAAASHVSVILERRGDQVRAIVEDDGRGFDAEAAQQVLPGQRRLGLLGMRERAALVGGELTIESSHGSGTSVFVRIPLPHAMG